MEKSATPPKVVATMVATPPAKMVGGAVRRNFSPPPMLVSLKTTPTAIRAMTARADSTIMAP